MNSRRGWLLGVVCLAAAAVAVILAGRGEVPRATPRLVVMVVVDQLRADYLDRFKDRYEGGLGWLVERGAWFTDVAYRHASTVTAAGHATVATGRHPSSHGIVGNNWRAPGRGEVYCIEDDRYSPVGGPAGTVSPLALQAPTLGDLLKERHRRSRVYSFSWKDRSAVLMAGPRADGAYWFEPGCGCFASSSFYGSSLPAWLEDFNAARPAAPYAGREWTRLLPDDALYERLARRDEFPGERGGADAVFPHGRGEQGYEASLAATPFSDELTLAAAGALLASGEIGRDEVPDLLALGLSSTDSVGHSFGPYSQEAMDNHLRLDRALGRFLGAVDELVGLEHVAWALTADHGAMPLVEHLAAGGAAAERFDTASLWSRAEKAITECSAGPAAETVDHAAGTALHWNEGALRAVGTEPAEASACIAEWLEGQRGVEAVLTAEQLASGPLPPLGVLFRNSYFPGRSPHVRLHLGERFYPGTGTGTGHGSAHPHDRRVPVLLAGAGVAPGRYEGPAGPEDVAPTLAALLGIEMGVEPDCRLLSEALLEEPR